MKDIFKFIPWWFKGLSDAEKGLVIFLIIISSLIMSLYAFGPIAFIYFFFIALALFCLVAIIAIAAGIRSSWKIYKRDVRDIDCS